MKNLLISGLFIICLVFTGCASYSYNGDDLILNERIELFNETDIMFDFDVYNTYASINANNIIEFKADLLKHLPGITVFITGHADTVGTDKYNLNLGRNRAEQVARDLIHLGVNPEQIVTLTYGEKELLYPEVTYDTNWMERRVTTKIIGFNSSN